MGTNYYLDFDGDELHIGKSSHGWTFTLKTHTYMGIGTLYDWIPWMLKYPMSNEYGDEVSLEQMLQTIMCRSFEPKPRDESWYKANHAKPGPNGLCRHTDGEPGAGTWDYFDGEFS